jgi:hypothetical protein
MVQFAMLTAAWVLMRRYTARRRTRIDRESIVRQLTEKLRAMAKSTARRSRQCAQKQSTLAVLSV